MMAKIIWATLAVLGVIASLWYFWVTSRGRIGYPKLLWHPIGHVISWIVVVLGVVGIVMLVEYGWFIFLAGLGALYFVAHYLVWTSKKRWERTWSPKTGKIKVSAPGQVKCPFCKKWVSHSGNVTKPYSCNCGAYGEWEIKGKALRFSKGNQSRRGIISR